ncbi:hypothetical protein [Gluconobacter morbifer]|uniref:hypothetical protein n=1 Tax=Gluconobacter morbifer TaxID=479935 RepID=UPI001FDFB93F|nr:hypothetical protein [Gluconobacter morbifer]
MLIRAPVTWAPGFHCCAEIPPQLTAPLFLFHLRYADLSSGLARLKRTREQPWCSDDAGRHQRLADTDWENMLNGMAALPCVPVTLDQTDRRLANWRRAVEQSAVSRHQERYQLDLHLSGTELWKLPSRFIGRI